MLMGSQQTPTNIQTRVPRPEEIDIRSAVDWKFYRIKGIIFTGPPKVKILAQHTMHLPTHEAIASCTAAVCA